MSGPSAVERGSAPGPHGVVVPPTREIVPARLGPVPLLTGNGRDAVLAVPASAGSSDERGPHMTAVLDDFDLDIRIGDALGRLAVMQRETEDCSTEIACETDSGLGCGPVRS